MILTTKADIALTRIERGSNSGNRTMQVGAAIAELAAALRENSARCNSTASTITISRMLGAPPLTPGGSSTPWVANALRRLLSHDASANDIITMIQIRKSDIALTCAERGNNSDHRTMQAGATTTEFAIALREIATRCHPAASTISIGRILGAPPHSTPLVSPSLPRDAAALVSSAVDILATGTL